MQGGRSQKIGAQQQNQEGVKQLLHWSKNPKAVELIQIITEFGAFKSPVETGIKAKYTKEEREKNIQGDEKMRGETNKKIEKFLSNKLQEMKKQTDQAQEYAHKFYKIKGSREFYLILEKDENDVISLDAQGKIIDKQKQKTQIKLFFFEDEQKKYRGLQDCLNQVSYLLTENFVSSLEILANKFIKFSRNKDITQDQIIEDLKAFILENQKEFSEILACQYVKDSKRECHRKYLELKLDPQIALQALSKEENSKANKKNQKYQNKRQQQLQQQTDIQSEMLVAKQHIEEQSILIKEFLSKLIDYFASFQKN